MIFGASTWDMKPGFFLNKIAIKKTPDSMKTGDLMYTNTMPFGDFHFIFSKNDKIEQRPWQS